MSQRVVIVGPNLRDQTKGSFHVHAEGCADLRRDPNVKHENQGWVIEADTVEDVAEAVYSDMMEESDSPASDYVSDFHFAPCVTLN